MFEHNKHHEHKQCNQQVGMFAMVGTGQTTFYAWLKRKLLKVQPVTVYKLRIKDGCVARDDHKPLEHLI